jgi:type II secretory pathway component PulF
MLNYQYTARNPSTGEQVKAMVEADSEGAAAKLISDQGLVPVEIKLHGGGNGLLSGLTNHVKARDRVLFSRQLSTLINAGLPLLQALRSVNQQTVEGGGEPGYFQRGRRLDAVRRHGQAPAGVQQSLHQPDCRR